MTDTLAELPPEAAPYEPYKVAALRFLATGLTAEGVRAHAADALYVERTARIAGIPAHEAHEELLLIADAIERLEFGNVTPQQAYARAGLDGQYGPYPGPDSIRAA